MPLNLETFNKDPLDILHNPWVTCVQLNWETKRNPVWKCSTHKLTWPALRPPGLQPMDMLNADNCNLLGNLGADPTCCTLDSASFGCFALDCFFWTCSTLMLGTKAEKSTALGSMLSGSKASGVELIDMAAGRGGLLPGSGLKTTEHCLDTRRLHI